MTRFSFYLTAALSLVTSAFADDLKPMLIAPGQVIVAERFDVAELSAAWRIRSGLWTSQDGIITGKKSAMDKHPAKLELMRPWQDGLLKFAFKLSAPGGLDIDLYQGETRVAVLRLRAESLSFGAYPKTGPSKAINLAQAEGGFATDVWHQVMIERIGPVLHIQRNHGPGLKVTAPDLPPGFTSSLFILRGEENATLQMDEVLLTASK